MPALLGSVALAAILILAERRGMKPLWPALAFAMAFTMILFLTRAGSVSNVAGGLAAGVAAYFLSRLMPEIINGVGRWFAVLLILVVPAGCLLVADRARKFIESL